VSHSVLNDFGIHPVSPSAKKLRICDYIAKSAIIAAHVTYLQNVLLRLAVTVISE
jgi:hypothetical protein